MIAVLALVVRVALIMVCFMSRKAGKRTDIRPIFWERFNLGMPFQFVRIFNGKGEGNDL